MFFLAIKSLLLLCFLILITGCYSPLVNDVKKTCSNNPDICEDLPQISDCRILRSTLIQARYDYALISNDQNTLRLFEELDAYKVCLELTLEIEFTRNIERKTKRLVNYSTAEKLTENLLQSAKNITDPRLGYYLWSNHQDLQAKRVFLNAANQANLKDVHLLTQLAIYYSADAPQRALQFYYNALRYNPHINQLPQGLLVQLTSLLYRHQQYQLAYLWAVVITKTSIEKTVINLEMIAQKGAISTQQQKQLRQLASKYIKSLEKGTFHQPSPNILQRGSQLKTMPSFS